MFFDPKKAQLASNKSYLSFLYTNGQLLFNSSDEFTLDFTLFELQVCNGFSTELSEDCIAFKDENTDVSCAFYDKFTMLFKGTKPLTLKYCDRNNCTARSAVIKDNRIHICESKTNSHLWFVARKGSLRLQAEWQVKGMCCSDVKVEFVPENGEFEVVFYRTKSIDTQNPFCPSFEECTAEKRLSFAKWCKKMNADTDFRKEMAFALWQNVAAPYKNYKQDTIVCAKATMRAIWSWDNCFHALGVAAAYPELAFYQYMIIFENMDENGAMPDSITPHELIFGFTKPPVHAFIYELLMKRHPFFCEKQQIEKVYYYLSRNFKWWLTARDSAPIYWHGNDSGADNSTCFDRFPHIQSPDLHAFLSYTAKMLSKFARMLGNDAAAKEYKKQAESLGLAVEEKFFDGERFFVLPADSKGPHYCDSLLPLRCLAAGEYLSKGCIEKTVSILENEFLGDYGLTSEAFKSDKHLDGAYASYWRGSVWGCEQILIAESLKKLGKTELANKILANYRRALQVGGAGENSNSLTGEGNCTDGYSWSAAVEFYIEP